MKLPRNKFIAIAALSGLLAGCSTDSSKECKTKTCTGKACKDAHCEKANCSTRNGCNTKKSN